MESQGMFIPNSQKNVTDFETSLGAAAVAAGRKNGIW
jgi:hypothetical protein